MTVVPKNVRQRLQRITTSGSYIPALDGLRFFAISWVALYHLHGSFSKKAPDSVVIDYESWFHTVMVHGRQGVPIFFALSGFFLCLPFARQYLQKKSGLVNVKGYYMRRMIRIVPPYWIAVAVLSVMYVLLDKYSTSFLIPHIGASLGFAYTLVFQHVNILNTAFWALEAEIQFYLIAPLMVYLYFTMPGTLRRLAVIVLIGALPFIQVRFEGPISFTLLNYVQYFLAGFLICDVYISQEKSNIRSTVLLPLLALIALPLILFTAYDGTIVERMLYPVFIIVLSLSILFNRQWNTILSWQPMVTIGGMSYTIYLIHFPIIGFFGTFTMPVELTGNYYIAFLIQCLLILPIVLLLSFVFYLIAERPFMQIRPSRRMENDRVVESDVVNISK